MIYLQKVNIFLMVGFESASAQKKKKCSSTTTVVCDSQLARMRQINMGTWKSSASFLLYEFSVQLNNALFFVKSHSFI